MKNLFAIAAMFAAVIFTGCSKDDDGVTYSGDFIGSWVIYDSWYDTDNSGWEDKCVMTFKSNGVITMEYEYTEYDSSGNVIDEEYGKYSSTYTYSNGTVTAKYVDEDGYDIFYIEVSGDTLTLTEEGGDTEIYTRLK